MINRKDDAISSGVRGEGHVIRLSLPVSQEELSVVNVVYVRIQTTSAILNCL